MWFYPNVTTIIWVSIRRPPHVNFFGSCWLTSRLGRSGAQPILCQRIHPQSLPPLNHQESVLRLWENTRSHREDMIKGRETIPVLVQHSSKDSRCMAQTVHQVPTPQNKLSAPKFDPSPVYGAAQGCTPSEECDEMGEPNGPERMRPHYTL